MSNNPQSDYIALMELKKNIGYQVLEVEWLHQVAEIEDKRDKAANRGTESAWRYYAGLEKGFKLAMTKVDQTLMVLEEKLGEQDKNLVDKLFEEVTRK